MRELITEGQSDTLILALSIAVTLGSLGFGLYRGRGVRQPAKRLFWVRIALCALVGPVLRAFWDVYNSIEDYYGLDSLKALGINFAIAVGIGAVFFVLFSLAPRWAGDSKAVPGSK